MSGAAKALETACNRLHRKFIFSSVQPSPTLYSAAQPIGARDGGEVALRIVVSRSIFTKPGSNLAKTERRIM
jgi:hypothetical protein